MATNSRSSPQVKILRALVENGGELSVKEISVKTRLSVGDVHGNGRHLISRSLIRKKTEQYYDHSLKQPRKITYYYIRPQKRDKVIEMLREVYREDETDA